ncbi:unnamed protein product, partial [Polarella glacialis]
QAELTHNYLDVRSPLAVRRQQLKEGWGFTCKCDRCLLEEAVWTDVKLQNEGQLLWQAFHVMIAQRKGGLSAMSQLVQAMERITDQALEQYLVQQISKSGEEGLLGGNPWFAQFRPAFELTPKQTRLLMSGQEVQGHDVAVLAFKRLRNCLLASHWLSPAMQLSHGLRDSRRFDQSLELLGKIIAVLKEVLPHSSLHVATCVQRAACAADAGRPEPEARALFFGVAQVAEAAYGDGGAALEILMEARLAGDDAAAALLNTCLEGLRGGESCVHEAALTGLAESQPAGSSSEVRRTEVDESKSLLQAAEAVPGYATTRRTLKSGVGPAVGVGSRVTLHATGVVAETGRKFWSTKDPGCQPFTYQAGVGEVITGWDQGCLGMVLGEERQLLIPAAEGYGAQGFAAWAIPPYATLDFTLECLSIQGGSSPARPAATQEAVHGAVQRATCAINGKELREAISGKGSDWPGQGWGGIASSSSSAGASSSRRKPLAELAEREAALCEQELASLCAWYWPLGVLCTGCLGQLVAGPTSATSLLEELGALQGLQGLPAEAVAEVWAGAAELCQGLIQDLTFRLPCLSYLLLLRCLYGPRYQKYLKHVPMGGVGAAIVASALLPRELLVLCALPGAILAFRRQRLFAWLPVSAVGFPAWARADGWAL